MDLSAARDSTQLDPVLIFVEAPEEVPGFVKAELPDKAKWHRCTVRKEKNRSRRSRRSLGMTSLQIFRRRVISPDGIHHQCQLLGRPTGLGKIFHLNSFDMI